MKCELEEIKTTDSFEVMKEKTINNDQCKNAAFAVAMTPSVDGKVLAIIF